MLQRRRKHPKDYVRRRARELAESGQFERWQGIEFQLRFIEGLPGAHKYLSDEDTKLELDILCQQAKSRKQRQP
jgi:hypothetical protein